MAVKANTAPEGSVAEFLEHVPAARPSGAGDGVDDHQPHPVVDMRLDDVVHRREPGQLTPSGWRYIVRNDDGSYAAAEVGVSDSQRHTFRALDEGPHAGGSALVQKTLDEHYLVAQYDYRVGLLRIPSCRITAIWLRGDGHRHQMVVPLDPAPPKLRAGRSYSIDKMLDIVRGIARQRTLAADDLTRIEGIGPQIDDLLFEAGIATFAELAAATPAQLRATLNAGGSHFHRADPGTWPEQAALAKSGSWAELDQLQDTLKGGRRS